MKPRSVQSERATRADGGDTITPSEWPVTTKSIVADMLKAEANNDPSELNQKIYSLVKLKTVLKHAELQIGVAMREHRENPRVIQRLTEIHRNIRSIQDVFPLTIR